MDRIQLLRIDPSESRPNQNLENPPTTKKRNKDLATRPETPKIRLVVETLFVSLNFVGFHKNSTRIVFPEKSCCENVCFYINPNSSVLLESRVQQTNATKYRHTSSHATHAAKPVVSCGFGQMLLQYMIYVPIVSIFCRPQQAFLKKSGSDRAERVMDKTKLVHRRNVLKTFAKPVFRPPGSPGGGGGEEGPT